MEQLELVVGMAPRFKCWVYQDGSVVDLEGASATFRWRNADDDSDTFSVACTGECSTGYCYATVTSTAVSTAGEYLAELAVTGLSNGDWISRRHKFRVREALT